MATGEVHAYTVTFGDPTAARKLFALKAPTDADGGGIRILEAWAVSTSTLALSQGVGGTTFTLALHKYTSSGADGGTPAVNGTIAAAIGGTAQGWTAGIERKFTLDSNYTFLDAGEWAVIDYAEVNAGNPVLASVTFLYAMGK